MSEGIDPGIHTNLPKPNRILSKREADTEFQYRPHIVETDTIADSIFADAISETSRRFSDEKSASTFEGV